MQLNLIAPFNKMSYGYVGCFLYEELNKLIDVKAQCIRDFGAEERFGSMMPLLKLPTPGIPI